MYLQQFTHPLSFRCKCTHTHTHTRILFRSVSITLSRSFSLPPSVRCQKRISHSPAESKIQKCDHVAVVSPKLPDKNYSARDQRARWVCFQIPNLWAKKGGTCNPTADISSLHAAHFRVCRRLSCPKLSADSLRSLCTSSQLRHLWSNEPATDRAKSGDMRECASF